MPTYSGSAVTTNDYSSVNEVKAFTRHLLDGQTTFNSTTRPTLTEVTRFLTRASAVMNSALQTVGLAVPVTQADAKAAVDDWVTQRTTEYVELTQRGQGFGDGEDSRYVAFRNMSKSALDFVTTNRQGWIHLGVTSQYAPSGGLTFTGMDAEADRADPDDTSLAQPKFRRGLFDSPGYSGMTESDE